MTILFTLKQKKAWLFILAISFAFVTILSGTTSPLYSQYAVQGDSAIFQTIGKCWAEGKTPYIDVFDHKGPLIFFIDAVGYYIAGSRIGIYLLQVVFMTVSTGAVYILFRMLLDEKTSMAFSLCVVISTAVCYSSGNMTEEYILPLISISIVGMYQWIYRIQNIQGTKSVKHDCRWTLVYGITFGFALMTRLTNALGVCLGVAIITIYLITHGEWKNLLQNAICFILGASIITIPFIVYFACKDAQYDMWYATLLYNFDYMADSGLKLTDLRKVVYYARGFMPVYGLLMVELLLFVVQRKIDFCSMFWTMISAATLVLLLRSNGYEHYAMIGVPYIAIGILEFYRVFDMKRKKSFLYGAMILFVTVNVLSSSADIILNVNDYVKCAKNKSEYESTYSVLLKEVPEQERDSLAGYNVSNGFYLLYDIIPSCKYFILQESQSSYGEQQAKKIHDAFVESETKWILLTRAHEGSLEIDDILETSYSNVATVNKDGIDYQLYCHRNS